MKWKKIGQIFAPEGQHPWMQSHASNVVAMNLGGDRFRAYFSCRDDKNRSSIGFIEFDIREPKKVLTISSEPVLQPGPVGLFDDSGVSLSTIVEIEGRTFMYYLGWNLGVTVPWRNSIGLAILNPKTNKFEKFSPAPLLDRNHVDPYSISYPFVLRDGNMYHMWYGSNLDWGAEQTDMAHVIKYATSSNGIDWKRDGHVALPFKDKSEYAMSRPFVIKEDGVFKMWYSYRGTAYRIGYAESENARDWQRMDDKVGIDVSPSGWDSKTVEYPFIVDHGGQRFMFYNGNDYGRTGFGLAVLE